MKKPNFFIVGAPKCGTTSLSMYLKSHPQVFFTDTKELNYFNTDFAKAYRNRFGPHRIIQEEDAYLKLFKNASRKHKAVGEGTVWYMYSQVAIKKIWEFNKNAKIIVMLRNPVDMAYSLHAQLLYSFNENMNDFEEAWNLQERRKCGKNIPKTCLEPKLLQYRDVCMLGSQMDKIYQVFPKENIMVILFENFIERTSEVYQNVLAFLELESQAKVNFPKINVNKRHRVDFINRWLLGRPPLWILKPMEIIRKLFKVESLGVYPLLMKYNVSKDRRKPKSSITHQMLSDVFSEDIDQLEKLIGVDLDHWKGRYIESS